MQGTTDSSRESRADRQFPALMAYWFAFCLYRLDRDRLHPSGFDGTFAIIMGLVSGACWLAFTPARLKKLGLTRLWMVPLAIPFGVAIFGIWTGWDVVCWVALAIGAAAQWLLVFRMPSGALEQAPGDGPAEPPV
jgi:hypothetical protein